ncbi:hypothetical protein CYMTET_8602 [Cymbomonas tetramitiformis]|uniref:Uncharacterized protein n=1 Tax=Cymbomonas tetramitiformis TaxID=36881 RepID=A0AAE0GST0_9CHLO|nr:hypothetical protein CYMTET_8602 [Cymbomonas tetramitiformis]
MLSVGHPAQPLQQAIVKESEKKELGMPLFQTMLGFHSDVEVDYLNGVLKKIQTTEITIPEAIETLKRFKNQRNVQAWIVSQSGVENWDAFEKKYDCNTWLTRCQAGEGDLGQLPVNYVPNTVKVALPSPLVEDGKEALLEKEYEMKTVQTGYMIYKDELTKLESVPKLHYVGTILDVIYDFDTEVSEHALSEPDLIKFIDAFAALTTSPDWTILIFCGFAQQTGFLKILESKCNEDATQLKAPVAPFSLPISRVGIAYWNPTIVIDDDEYHGIPYQGRKPTHSASSNSEDSGTGAVSWSKEKLPDSDDNDDAGVTNSKEKLPDSDDKDDAGVIHDMDPASPKWEPTSPEYDDTEDDVSEFDDLVADDAEEQADARRLKRLGLQLIMDEKGELHWVPKGTSPTSPVQPDDQPITEQKSEAISEDAPASVVETVHAPPKKPYGSDTGLTSMGENKAGVSEETKRHPRKYPRCWTHEYITQLKYSIRSDSDEEEGLDVAPRRKKAKISKGQ